ncbi:transcriptional regulator [Nocardioides insulae]|uniref:transcriptional regulator n=1 Tax=Nocardioides insulae TaxID=394734 RepID=UPI000401CE22|nr:transcriptional regulator [Nocardioides insulae]
MIAGLDPLIHPPKRLAAMALLAHAQSVDFPFLRDHLQVSDSDLSKQMSALAAAGYVRIDKQGRGRGSVTTFRITKDGRRAYRAHRQALQDLLDQVPARIDQPPG